MKHIVLRTEVVKIQEADDHDLTGKWNVSTKNLETNEIKSEVFDSGKKILIDRIYNLKLRIVN